MTSTAGERRVLELAVHRDRENLGVLRSFTQALERRAADGLARRVPRDRAERVRVARARQRAQRDDLAAGGLGDLRQHARHRAIASTASRLSDSRRALERLERQVAQHARGPPPRTLSSASSRAMPPSAAGVHQLADGGAADTRVLVLARHRGNRLAVVERNLGDVRQSDGRIRMLVSGSACGIGRAASSRGSSLVAATSLWRHRARRFRPCQETNHVILVVIGRRAGRRGCSFFLTNVFISKNADPAAALVLACGIGTTACDKLGLGDEDPTSPSPVTPGTPIRYTAVGASDVVGYGSSAPCLVLFGDCPESKGYVFVAAGRLRSDGYTVTVTNRGIPTATISRLFSSSACSTGSRSSATCWTASCPFVPRDSTVVTIFAGGNDVNVITAALGGGAGAGNQTAFVDQQVQNFATDYRRWSTASAIVLAPRGAIIALNLPNLSRLPYVASAPLPQRQAVQRAAVGMTTTAINPMAARGVRVIDLMCLAALYSPASLSSDGFHPSDAGYALIAAEVVRAVTASSFPAPQASCPQMTM